MVDMNPDSPLVGPTMAQPQCSQCNMYHPPLSPGQECPNATTTVTTINGVEFDPVDFIVQAKSILISKIKGAKIKDPKKLMGLLLVNTSKFLEDYEEE